MSTRLLFYKDVNDLRKSCVIYAEKKVLLNQPQMERLSFKRGDTNLVRGYTGAKAITIFILAQNKLERLFLASIFSLV
jgi:hypothetical protein